jgi:N-acetylglutamate synthase-like GNAT family acetyltransferase
MSLIYQPVLPEDFDAMAAIRAEALRESLERLGRFNEQRSRERLQSQFEPEFMQHICWQSRRIGFYTLRAEQNVLRLHHLYILPANQNLGLGSEVMKRILQIAKEQKKDVTLGALKQSKANDFYLSHGFQLVQEEEFDNEYRWFVEKQ